MKDLVKLVRYEMKNNRKSILVLIFGYSLLCTLFSLFFQVLNLLWLGIIIILIFSFLFVIQLHQFIFQRVQGKENNWSQLFKIPKIEKSHMIILPVLLGIIAALFIILYFISSNPLLVGLALVFLLSMMIVSNAIFQIYLYLTFEGKYGNIERIKKAVSLVFSEKKALTHLLVRYVRFMMIGGFLTFSANVFVYAKQLEPLLQSPETEPIQKIFASDLSFVVQSTGIQMTVLYIMIYSGFLYAYLNWNSNHKAKKKRK